jgi:toxin YoeB
MKFTIHFDIQADKDIKKILKSAKRSEIDKLKTIIDELENHPATGTGKPEQLRFELSGYWSRRLNKKDQIIYEINEDEAIVTVLSALGHY